MKYSTLIVVTTLAVVLSLSVHVALAAGTIDLTTKLGNLGTNAGFSSATPSVGTTIGLIVNGLLSVLGVVFMGYIIYAGFLWLTARGEEEKITKAKAIIRGSIIGVIVVMAAFVITNFVLDQIIRATNYTN